MKKLVKASIMLAVIALSISALSCGKKNSENEEPSDPAFEEQWFSDFEAAKSKAKTEQKDLFIRFTGSDWCVWCSRLGRQVLQTKLFEEEAPKYFVLVVLDFPRDKSGLSQQTIQQNEKLYKEYSVPGFPTVILADSKGRAYARTGYRPGGPKKYLEHLQNLRKLKP